MTVAPYPSVAARLAAGASSGMRIVAGVPRSAADRATAWAWLPDDQAHTPRASSSPDNREIRLYAPRNLNAPARCRFSAFSSSVAPVRSSRVRDVSTGVRWATPASLSAAAFTSSNPITPPVYHLAPAAEDTGNSTNLDGFSVKLTGTSGALAGAASPCRPHGRPSTTSTPRRSPTG